MQTQDYYTILELPPSATQKEIKTAYRRLAHQYHPDKNPGDPYAASQFERIKEAYEILSNPSRKEQYLQQRWYDQSIGKKNTATIITPVTVLKQLLELDKYVTKLDVHRMDKEGLYAYICHILSDETITKLIAFNEPGINNSIIDVTLQSSRSLTWHHIEPLTGRLMKLNPDEATLKRINHTRCQSRQAATWNKYKTGLLLLLVAALCCLIYFMSA